VVFKNSDFQLQDCHATIICEVSGSDKSTKSTHHETLVQIGIIGLFFSFFTLNSSSLANLLSSLGISTQINLVPSTGASILNPFSTSRA